MAFFGKDSLNTKKTLHVGGKEYDFFSIKAAEEALGKDLSKLPYSLKIVFENLLRFENGKTVTVDDIRACADWLDNKKIDHEIAYSPARVLMQDFTGVPAVVDLAAMRDAMGKLGGDEEKINPLSPVDLVIDHSVQVDKYGTQDSFKENEKIEMERNIERYEFLRWGQEAFDNFRVVPPSTGICHQVNLEYLSQVVWTREDEGRDFVFPDTLVGTDSHTTMVNGLAVLGWGVGGIEAEAVMLGQPMSMLIPEVIGFKMTGLLSEGVTATDLVLTVTQMLREKGVVNKFVEFFGEGINNLKLSDRATLANMAPEYGATCGFFPIDKETIRYLKLSARDDHRIELVEEYAKAQGMWYDENSPDPEFTDILELDLSTVMPSIAGPKRPQDKVLLSDASKKFVEILPSLDDKSHGIDKFASVAGEAYKMGNGDIVIAAITSCTNTSNPNVMIAAGLVAKKACEKGLKAKEWVKTSLAPGSKVVSEYLEISGLQPYLNELGFDLVGYGCTTCIGNSGPLKSIIEDSIKENDLVVASVLSGNRNFEGRVHPLVKANYLASPPLVVAYALAGSMNVDLTNEPLGEGKDGNPVYLKDIWPTNDEIAECVESFINPALFKAKYSDVFKGDEAWQNIRVEKSLKYKWNDSSTYIANPPYFEGMEKDMGSLTSIKDAYMLAKLGDSITTDHISPAGNIAKDSPAGKYLMEHDVEPKDFNSYGSRRGNHEIMMRGTFANIRIKNELAPGTEGGFTTYAPSGEVMTIYDAAMKYKETDSQLVVIAGKEYGTGSSRDWAAKGTLLLGVKAVIAESFERIHRSNLVRMGVIPLAFKNNMSREDLRLDGNEKFSIEIPDDMKAQMDIKCTIVRKDGSTEDITLMSRIDTEDEADYFKNGGILQYVIRHFI